MSQKFFIPSLGDVNFEPIWPSAGPPTSGTSGTFAGVAHQHDLLLDNVNFILYVNTNTTASPTWTALGGEQSNVNITGGKIRGVTVAATYASQSYAGGLVAVGSSRTNALALTAAINRVVTAASSAVGVILPASATIGVGGTVTVINDGPGNSFKVYAAGSDTIDTIAGTTGVVLTNAFQCVYQVDTAGAFVSYRSAVTRSA